ncbi:MAG: response regulator [Alkalispirochaetaceae bacterium]
MVRASILFVDDEAINLLNMKYMLEDSFVVHTARSGDSALALLQEKEVNVILTDQKMPGMTGVELAHRIRQEDKELPILIVTGYVDDDEVNDAVERGLVQEIIYKPYTESHILETIRQHAHSR